MGLIIKKVVLLGTKNIYKEVDALFDTGASLNCIGWKFRDSSSLDNVGISSFGEKKDILTPTGHAVEGIIINLKELKIGEKIVKNPKFCLFQMVHMFGRYDLIIGAELMQELGISLKPITH